jgi:aspartyl/asparaginyl beta-hydroxylase (cupin superfamily)
MDKQSLTSELEKADALARQGDFVQAIDVLCKVVDDMPDQAQALTMLGRVYRANGQFNEAITVLKNLIETNPTEPWTLYDLGETYETVGDFTNASIAYLGAWSLNRENARYALNAGFALWQDNKKTEALNIWSIGSDMDPLVRAAQFKPEADDATRMKSKTADIELRRHFTQMHRDGLLKHGNPERLKTTIWPQTHLGAVEYKVKNQKPYMFYAPDLPARPVFDVSKLAWAAALKKATPDITNELQDYLKRTDDYGRPYLAHMSDGEESWKALQGSEDWNALHLFKDAKEQSCLSAFPKTRAALEGVPMVEMFGTPMEVFFSVLKPETHIPPHFGLSNSRLTAHLPLIIPDNCEIRVSDHIHHWRVGEVFAFDDSFDHEAHNDSSEIRIVLIFETWRPDLRSSEIAALQDSMETRSTWLNNRKIPDLKFN